MSDLSAGQMNARYLPYWHMITDYNLKVDNCGFSHWRIYTAKKKKEIGRIYHFYKLVLQSEPYNYGKERRLLNSSYVTKQSLINIKHKNCAVHTEQFYLLKWFKNWC